MDFISTLLVLLLAGLSLILFADNPPSVASFLKKFNSNWLFISQLLFVFVSQLSRIRNQEYNVDESTWIANALAVKVHDDFFAALLTYTTARPVTVLPLLVLDSLGLSISFYSVKVISLICIVSALGLTFLALRNVINTKLATLCLLPLTAFYIVVDFDDFVAYNSELVCNIFIAAALWLYSLIRRQQEHYWHIVLTGLALGLIPFTKFQAIPGALIIVLFCLYEWIRQDRRIPGLVFVVAGLTPISIAVVYCLYTDQLTILVRNYFLYYVHYSYQYSSKPFLDRLSPRDILWYYRKQYAFAACWFGLVAVIIIMLWQKRNRGLNWSSSLLLAITLWVVSIYETIQAGTNYEHYLNLVLVPHTLLAAALVGRIQTN